MVRVIRKNKIKKLDEIGQDNVVMNDSYDKLVCPLMQMKRC
jgi:hypothetical protein